MKAQKTDLKNLSEMISDQVWELVQFWSPFSQTIIGNRFIQCLDEITILASQVKKVKKDEKSEYEKKITLLTQEAMVWLDKARRRRLISNDDYQKLYTQINNLHLLNG